MMRNITTSLVLAGAVLLAGGCRHAKVQNPLANVDSKQPDKNLFDNAMNSMKKGQYTVSRTLLETLINAYPDSEYIARAKMAVGDSWYAEGGTAGLQQAELQYKDFITFFPNMPEAAEAQLKVANIHYRQLEKSDRDYTQALRAADEYKTLIQQYPDNPLVPQAKQRLREVQEVLAEHQYGIARFYFLRENMAAAEARLESLIDSYPLYSEMDESLYLLGNIYEKEAASLRNQKNVSPATREGMTAELEKKAIATYSRIITRYPAMNRAEDAKKRLLALKAPVPTPTPEALAESRAEENSRRAPGKVQSMLGGFKRHPNVSMAAKVGEPSLEDEKIVSAPAIVHSFEARMQDKPLDKPEDKPQGPTTASHSIGVEQVSVGKGNAPAANEAAPGSADGATTPPAQVNEIQSSSADPKAGGQASPNSSEKGQQDSSSKKKGKKGLRKLIPF